MSRRAPGRIITFYSYKGGTGRSMALANVGWILASRQKRVLLIDWDLEAPGLHRYFHPFLVDKGLTASEGIIDFFMRFEEAATVAPSEKRVSDSDAGAEWYRPFADPTKYIVPLAWPFAHGTIDLMPAGKQGASYAARVNSFNWANFYDRLGGGVFIEAMKEWLRESYDYILVDSRTGVSDTAGVCTVQMPDDVVVCFTYNVQSIEGGAAVSAAIRTQREVDAKSDPPAFRIFPVPMRVERAEHERLLRAREFGRNAFAGFVDHLKESRRNEYWGEIEVPYVPYYAYQEILATIAEPPGGRDSFARSCERIVDFVTEVKSEDQQTLPEIRRDEIKQLFLRGAEAKGIRVALTRYPELQEFSDELVTQQKAWLESDGQDRHLLDPTAIERLRGRAELMIALLEEPLFREFFNASERRIIVQKRRRSLWKDVIALVAAAEVLAGIGAIRLGVLSAPGLDPGKYLELFVAGVLGAAWSELYRKVGKASRDAEWPAESMVMYVANLLRGAMAGGAIGLMIQSGMLGLAVTNDPTASLAEYVRTLLVPITAGAVIRLLTPGLLLAVAAVERDVRR